MTFGRLGRRPRLVAAGAAALGAIAIGVVRAAPGPTVPAPSPAALYVDFAAANGAVPRDLRAMGFRGGAVDLRLEDRDGRRVLTAVVPAGGAVAAFKTSAAWPALEETYTFVYTGGQSVVEPFFLNAHPGRADALEGFMTDLSPSHPGTSFAGTITYRYTDAGGKEQYVSKGRLRTEPYFYRTGHTYRVDAIADMDSGLLTTRVYDVALGPQTFDTRISSPSRGTLLFPGVLLAAGAPAIGDFAFGPVGRLPIRPQPARRAGDYLDYLGYNAAVQSGVSSVEGKAFVRYFPALLIKHVRVPAETRFLPAINAVARDGIDADVLTGNRTSLADLQTFIAALANPPDAIELWNEPNNPSEGAAYDAHFATDLPPFAAAVRKAYPRARIWGPSILPDPNGYPSAVVKLAGALGPLIDAWNAHSYTLGTPENLGFGGFFGDACGASHHEDCGWYGAPNYNDNLSAILNPDLPGVTTEGAASYGSYPDICGHTNVDLEAQQAYVERGMLYNYKLGHLRIYPYKFIDDGGCSDGFGTYGILSRLRDAAGATAIVPKPAYTSLVAFDHLLADDGPTARSFAPQPVAYTLDRAAPDIESLLLARSDGSYRLVLWSDASLWDFNANGPHAAGRALAVRSEPLTVRFARPVAAAVYAQTPGTGAWSFHAVDASDGLPVSVDGFPLVIAFDPRAEAPPANELPRDVPTPGPAETPRPRVQ